MSPRPRQVTDQQILDATLRTIQTIGPVRLTLADVARDLGISAPAIVRRFGSKRALLLALASSSGGGQDAVFDQLRARHRSRIGALLGMADCMAIMGETPEAIAHSLAFLQIDLTDPDFHRHALASSAAIHRGIAGLVRDAMRAGEIQTGSASRLASALQATMNGALLNWAIHRKGSVVAFIRRDLETVLDGCRPLRPRKPRRSRGTLRK